MNKKTAPRSVPHLNLGAVYLNYLMKQISRCGESRRTFTLLDSPIYADALFNDQLRSHVRMTGTAVYAAYNFIRARFRESHNDVFIMSK